MTPRETGTVPRGRGSEKAADWPQVSWPFREKPETTEGIYLSGWPITASPAMLLWGRRMMVSAAMPAEQALVGAFKVGAVLRWRHRLRVAITNTDADDFTRNLSTVRVELRAALVTDVPSAFGLVTGLTITP